MSAFLAVEHVSKQFGGLRAVGDVSFALAEGELVSLIGPNGAGKTTLFNLLTGQLAPTSGRVMFESRDISRLAPERRARLGFARTFQISQTLASMSVLENAMIGAFLHHRSIAAAADVAAAALDLVGLGARACDNSGALTLGERRRLEVARALAMKPRLVLLDEVMAGLNATEVNSVIQLVLDLNASGLAFLVIEHNLKVVRAFSRRVLVLNRGALLAEGHADHVLGDPAVVESYIGRRRV